MKKRNVLVPLAIGLYALLMMTERFVWHIPNYVSIPLLLLGLILLFIGLIKERRG